MKLKRLLYPLLSLLVELEVLIHFNESLKNFYRANGFCFVNNNNISEGNLHKDRLHLLEAGKCILANNFIDGVNNYYFIKAQTEESFFTKDRDKDTHSIDCTDLQTLKKDRLNYPRNPLIGYLNINSIRSNISDITEILGKLQLYYFVSSETTIDESFPSTQLNIYDYEIRNQRRDGDKQGVDLLNLLGKVFLQKE